MKVKVYKLKDGRASEQSDQVDDSEHKRTGSKVVDLEKRKSDDVLSMLGGIIGEIMVTHTHIHTHTHILSSIFVLWL